MIKKITIDEFRSCKKIAIDNIGPMTVLVGRNGAGKTNILRAIYGVARSATNRSPQVFRGFDYNDFPIRVAFEFELEGSYYRYRFDSFLERRPKNGVAGYEVVTSVRETLESRSSTGTWKKLVRRDNQRIRIPRRQEPILIGMPAPALPFLATFLPAKHSLMNHIEPVLGFLEGIRYYPMDEPNQSPERGPVILSGSPIETSDVQPEVLRQ